MSGALTHAAVVVVPDDGVSPVGSDEWNANHRQSAPGLLGRTAAGAGPVSVVGVGAGLELAGDELRAAAGGSAGEVQWNSDGDIAGAAGLTIEPGGRARFRDHAELDAIATPAAPVSGRARWYARQVAGRVRPYWLGPSGVDYELQPGIGGNRVSLIVSNASTGVTAWGTAATTTGNGQSASFAATSLRTSLQRTAFNTAATAGTSASVRTVANWWRGNAAGRGGFDLAHRFTTGPSAVLSGAQVFVGLTSTTSYTGDPSTTMSDLIGIGKDAADANWQVMRRAASGTAVKVDTGVAYATGQVIDLHLFAAPGGSSIFLRAMVRDWGGDTVIADAEYSTDLPGNTTALAQTMMVRNGTTASPTGLEFVQFYGASDY